MHSAGGFPLPCSSNSLLTTHTITSTSSSQPFPSKKTHFNHVGPSRNPYPNTPLSTAFRRNGPRFSSLRQSRRARLVFSPLHAQRRTGSRPSPSKKKKTPVLEEMGDLDDEFGGGDYDDGEFDDDEDGDGSVLLPFDKMNKWLESKPRGFGEGTVYDTSIEEQLLEEMRQSRLAQAANLDKLKKEPLEPLSNKDEQKKKADEVIRNGVRVRVVNLPKKKNVHRDLSTAFKGVPGMISINPVVSGNKKTRDPICKGFAFVYFKSEEHANRFIQMFSRQDITFGKIQKQIKCERINSGTSYSAAEQASTDNTTYESPQLEGDDLSLREDQGEDSETNDSSLNEWEERENSASAESDDLDDELNMSEWEDISDNLDSITVSDLSHSDGFEQTTESEFIEDSLPSNIGRIESLENKLRAKGKEEKVPGKKPSAKAKGQKIPKKNPVAKVKEVKFPKLDIPGSAKRLKVKEKAVLTDVFSKYGQKSAVASNEES